MLLYQVPLKFRYPFLAQIMWYAAEKYVRLLEQNKKELGLQSKPKAERSKRDTTTTKRKDDVVTPKGKSINKRAARSDVQEDDPEESKEEDPMETPGRRRSSRVARNEAIARQAQESTEKDTESADTEELSRKKGTPKKQAAKVSEDKAEVNGKNHDEDDKDTGEDLSEKNEEGEKTPWRRVYLTRFELEGLDALIERLRTWPQATKNVPSVVEDPDGLLDRLEVCANITLLFILQEVNLLAVHSPLQLILNIKQLNKSIVLLKR